MQKNDLALKRKLLVDGEEWAGLVECSELNDEESTVEVPSFNRIVTVKNGVKKFAPLTVKYKATQGSSTPKKFRDWYYKNEYHDVTVINTDATGTEVDRWLLRDCECAKFNESPYNAGGVEFFAINSIITCTSEPIPTNA